MKTPRDIPDGMAAEAAALFAENPGIGRRRMVAALGCSGFMAERILRELRAGPRRARPAPAGPGKGPDPVKGAEPRKPERSGVGIPVKEFGSRYDYEAKLRGVLREFCRDRFVSDADIRERCDIPIPAFRTVADLPEFRACQIKDRGTVFWSLKANVDEVRQLARRWGISK